ncbi:MAG TPA: leishmanolysin-related zinc metalloendopeptidase [Microthrixaceae bacterium]|nr:leishmanolysin-related zinc metalloendopeptidase [Microthrixaceae bacterium]
MRGYQKKRRSWRLAVVGPVVGCGLAVSGCVPPGGGGPTSPTDPLIAGFGVSAGSAPAPALLAYSWNVWDPNGDSLTCGIDPDGDGDDDIVVESCQGEHSRNFAFATPGPHVARLTVTDGNSTPVVATVALTITTGVSEPFDIDLRPVSPLSPEHQSVFDAAVARWEQLVVRGVGASAVDLPADDCLDGAAPFSGTIDDLMIEVVVRPIDGPGHALGTAGPCLTSSSDQLSRVGVMEFDTADVATMVATGTFDDVVLHEMGHVLGIGTLWNWHRSFLWGAGTDDPLFRGPRGAAAWSALGGNGGVPVESAGAAGTADAHWRESVFDDELMTGFIDAAGNSLSALSVASLADLGYQVSLDAADPYTLPSPFARRSVRAEQPAGVMVRPELRSS